MWEDACGGKGSCWVYDKYNMGIRIMLWFMGLKLLGALFFLIGSFVYKPPPGETKEREIRFPDNLQTVAGALESKTQTREFTKL